MQDNKSNIFIEAEVELAEELLKVPPDLDWCYEHQRATSIGKPKKKLVFCKCCGNNIEKQQLQFFEPTRNLSFLGVGVPLFFSLAGLAAVFLGILSFSFGLPSFINYTTGSGCSLSSSCIYTPFTIQSYYNVQNQSVRKFIEALLSLSAVVVTILLLFWMRIHMRTVKTYCDQDQLTASDFSVLIEMPHNYFSQNQIRTMLDIWVSSLPSNYKTNLPTGNRNFPVQKIINLYDVLQIQELQKYYNDSYQESKLLKFQGKLREAIRMEKNCKRAKGQLIEALQSRKFVQTPFVIICLKFIEQKELLERCNKGNLISRLLKGDRRLRYFGDIVQVQSVPQPSDINWIYYSYTYWQKVFGLLVSWLITFLISAAAFGLLLLTVAGQNYLYYSGKTNNQVVLIVPVVLASIVGLQAKIISYLSFTAEHSTRLKQWYHSTLMITFAQVATSTISLWGCFLIVYGNGPEGLQYLSESVFAYHVLMLVFPFIPKLINIQLISKMYSRQSVTKPFNSKLNQKEANALFEGQEIRPQLAYSFVLRLIFTAAAWGSLLPSSYFLAAVALFINFFIQKVYYYRFYKSPNSMGGQLAFRVLSVLDFTPLLQAIGMAIIQLNKIATLPFLQNLQLVVPNAVALAVGLFFVIYPSSALNPFECLAKEAVQSNKQYELASHLFETSYQLQNPVSKTREIAVKYIRGKANKTIKHLRPLILKYQEENLPPKSVVTVPREQPQQDRIEPHQANQYQASNRRSQPAPVQEFELVQQYSKRPSHIDKYLVNPYSQEVPKRVGLVGLTGIKMPIKRELNEEQEYYQRLN